MYSCKPCYQHYSPLSSPYSFYSPHVLPYSTRTSFDWNSRPRRSSSAFSLPGTVAKPLFQPLSLPFKPAQSMKQFQPLTFSQLSTQVQTESRRANQLAFLVYQQGKGSEPPSCGYLHRAQTSLQQMHLLDSTLPGSTQFLSTLRVVDATRDVVAYERTMPNAQKELYFAFRGTDGLFQKGDIKPDMGIVFNQSNIERLNEARSFCDRVINGYPVNQRPSLYFVGHSLGGFLAEGVAYGYPNSKVYTFNSAYQFWEGWFNVWEKWTGGTPKTAHAAFNNSDVAQVPKAFHSTPFIVRHVRGDNISGSDVWKLGDGPRSHVVLHDPVPKTGGWKDFSPLNEFENHRMIYFLDPAHQPLMDQFAQRELLPDTTCYQSIRTDSQFPSVILADRDQIPTCVMTLQPNPSPSSRGCPSFHLNVQPLDPSLVTTTSPSWKPIPASSPSEFIDWAQASSQRLLQQIAIQFSSAFSPDRTFTILNRPGAPLVHLQNEKTDTSPLDRWLTPQSNEPFQIKMSEVNSSNGQQSIRSVQWIDDSRLKTQWGVPPQALFLSVQPLDTSNPLLLTSSDIN